MRGFTLIELVLVITIIAIITSVSFALLNPALQLERARDAKRKADLAQIQAALELYRADQDQYPPSLPNCGDPLSISGITYLRSIPCDPKNSGDLVYNYAPSGATPIAYQIIACLESENDSEKDSSNNATYCSGVDNWSYTVANP